ncbi:MAG TPA: Crp/Fnr family transcriptional regulator [Pseudolabrys sp.]|nr:Crp/Fnr family transcriptional regulator [Pseudolabrys sp.]
MTARLELRKIETNPVPIELACALCPAFELNICEAASGATWAAARKKPIAIHQTAYVAPARKIVCREHDLHDVVPVICDGWAASVAMLSDSSRQILSFLLPGDLISTALLFEPRAHFQVEAITDVSYRVFRRAELKAAMLNNPALLENLSRAWSEEKTRSDQLIVDLGRRTADERIARLILSLAERLARRGMTKGEATEFEFPLRQHHIADATGLTPVHVSKVLSEFRRRGLIRISERSLTILDQKNFHRIAHTR